MSVDRSIFKSYDIRGFYPEQINLETAEQIAKSYILTLSKILNKEIQELKIAVGYDIRQASQPLGQALIATCLKLGVAVDDLGLISVNDIYFATGFYQYDGGVMLTASHNPAGYGGMKMVYLDPNFKNSVGAISGQEILNNFDEAQKINFSDNEGQLGKCDFFNDHLNHVLDFVDQTKIRPLKIVVDSGNGMNGKMAKAILEKLNCQVIELFAEPDGNFPNRAPNPLEKDAQQKCAQVILENQADFGVMFDVDGDRMFLVDEQGNFIRGDQVLILLAKSMLEKNPGAGIVYNLISTHAVRELVTEWGGRAIRSEVGYKNLTRHMKKSDAIMSGEVSGHFAFAKNYYIDNGFIAMALATEVICEAGESLSKLMSEFKLYAKGDEINLKVTDISARLDEIRQAYRSNILDEIDGITVEFENWWFNVRPSNTEPLLRVTVEAQTAEMLAEKTAEVVGLIEKNN
ncbi:MAG: phosphomannomutase/phosphoglucomutase [Patescibacteria group bacterium]